MNMKTWFRYVGNASVHRLVLSSMVLVLAAVGWFAKSQADAATRASDETEKMLREPFPHPQPQRVARGAHFGNAEQASRL
jgi:hypothetical protein